VRKIVLELVPRVETEFMDRGHALAQIAEWAEKSTRSPVNLLSCECNLRLVATMLRELGYDVVNVDVFT
jgi:hypothetical protein